MDEQPFFTAVNDPFFSDLPEREFSRHRSKGTARKYGQYFTPYPVARFMAQWINGAPNLRNILDPAAGLGIFFRAFVDVNPGFNGIFYGYEVDPTAFTALVDEFSPRPGINISFTKTDFLASEEAAKFDGILCNPPYIRYKSLQDRNLLIERLERDSGISISPLTNLYAYFIIRIGITLAPHGRAAVLVPAEFLNADYGTAIKDYLLTRRLLKHIILFDSGCSLFTDSITTSCILLLENDGQVSPVGFIHLSCIEELSELSSDLSSSVSFGKPYPIYPHQGISACAKWTRYFVHTDVQPKYQHQIPLSKIARAQRGIASGDNRFFTFNLEKAARYDIPADSLLPCLTRSPLARRPFFTEPDFASLENAGAPVYLLDASRHPDNPAIRAYLAFGQQSGSDQRFLTRNRTPWYRLEERKPAPILATTFNRRNLRFVRNEAGVRNLTCFHSIYIQPGFESRLDLLMAYLLTPLAQAFFHANRREYGDGLIKYEPHDLSSAPVADLDAIPRLLEGSILDSYYHYRESCLKGDPDPNDIKELDELFRTWMAPG